MAFFVYQLYRSVPRKGELRLGWGTGDLARGVCPHNVLWFLVFETRKLILEDEFLIARSWP